MQRILITVLAVSIMAVSFYRCSDTSTEIVSIESEPTQIDYRALEEESRIFRKGLSYALGEHLYQNGASSRIASNFESIEKSTLEYMDQFYAGYSEKYYKSRYNINSLSASSTSRIAEEEFDIDSIVTNPLQRYYIDRIGGGLIPAINEFFASSSDSTDIDGLKAYYKSQVNDIISDINNETNLSDSIKESLIAAAYVDMNIMDSRVILILDEMDALSEDDFELKESSNARTQGWLKRITHKAWRKVTYPFRGADPDCVALVFGSHIAVGVGIGWAAGDSNAGAVKVVTKTLGAVIGGAAGGLVAGWKFFKGKGKDACK